MKNFAQFTCMLSLMMLIYVTILIILMQF